MKIATLALVLPLVVSGCVDAMPPAGPSPITITRLSGPVTMTLEGEPGSGTGRVVQRSNASGGQTLHLGPGESREWTIKIGESSARYAIAVTYANGKEGPNERISVMVDGMMVSSFEDRDSGDSIAGWNTFVTDPAGASMLRSGSHTIVLSVSGGDGCVEIDFLTLSPS